MSFRCPACKRRVRSAPTLACRIGTPQDHLLPRQRRGGCLEAVTVELQRQGLGGILLGFYHTRGCGDPTGRMSCRGDSYKVGDSVEA